MAYRCLLGSEAFGEADEGFIEDGASAVDAEEFSDFSDFILEGFVGTEEVLDFLEVVRGEVVDGVDVVVAGVADVDSKDFDIGHTAVNHIHTANDAAVDIAAWEGGGGGEDEDIEGVAIGVEGVFDEAVFSGVVDRGVEDAIQLDMAGFAVDFVFIAASHGDFDSGFNDSGHGVRVSGGGRRVKMDLRFWRDDGQICMKKRGK